MSKDELRAKLKDTQDKLAASPLGSITSAERYALISEIQKLVERINTCPPPWCRPYPYKMTEGCTGCQRRKDTMEKGYAKCVFEGPDTIIVCRHCHPMGPSYELVGQP